jgi:hypothetical protein
MVADLSRASVTAFTSAKRVAAPQSDTAGRAELLRARDAPAGFSQGFRDFVRHTLPIV